MLLHVFAFRAIGAAATFGVGIYLARVLGADGFGIYTFVIGTATFIATIGQFGSGMALVKLRMAHDSDRSAQAIQGLYVWHILLSLVGVALAALFFWYWSRDTLNSVGEIVFAVPFVAWFMLFVKNIYQSEKRSDLSMLPDMLLVPSALAVTVFLLNITTPEPAIMAFVTLGTVVCAGLSFVFIVQFRSFQIAPTVTVHWRRWTWVASGFMVAQLGHALLFMQLPISYGLVAGPAELGNFSAAYKLAATQLIAFTAIGTYALPKFADQALMSNPDRLRQLMRQIIGVSITIAIPVFAVLLLIPSTIVNLLYGPEFGQAAYVLPILAAGIFVHTATGPLGNFLLMNGEERFYSTLSIACGLVGVGATLLMGEFFGLNGAAWAVGLTVAVWKLAICLRAVRLYRTYSLRGDL